MRVLALVRGADLSDAWVGAGALRDVVWGSRYGAGFDPTLVRDVDVAFYDLAGISDEAATARLALTAPDIPWEATNQATVHTCYHTYFGGPPIAPFVSVADAIATWPEPATCVAVQLAPDDQIEICAPLGMDELLGGVWRRNPRSISIERSRQRLERQQPQSRWPAVQVFEPETAQRRRANALTESADIGRDGDFDELLDKRTCHPGPRMGHLMS